MIEANLDDMYREVIIDHYKNPRGRKQIENPDVREFGANQVCGDEVEIAVKIEDGRIADVAVNSSGCSISVASGSMLAELLPGKTIEGVETLISAFDAMMNGRDFPDDVDIGDLDTLEGVRKFPTRIKCALLAWQTLHKIVKKWKNEPEADSIYTRKKG